VFKSLYQTWLHHVIAATPGSFTPHDDAMSSASSYSAAAQASTYSCGDWETNDLMLKFPFALRTPFKVGTPVFALVVNGDVQSWEYATIEAVWQQQ
jgi:hypothetical protein